MVLNRLIFPNGNIVRFNFDFSVDGEKYIPQSGEQFYMMVEVCSESGNQKKIYLSDDGYFCFECDIPEGVYAFELGVMDSEGNRNIVLPSYDERSKRLNELLVLRRL